LESKKLAERNHKTWLEGISKSSRKTYQRAWNYFTDFLGDKTEEWILDHKITEDWGGHLVDFHRWLKKQSKQRGTGTLSDNSVKQIAGAIRGYMNHVGLPISLTNAQKDELDKIESLAYRDYIIDLQTKEDLLRKANPLEEYIVSVGISFGLRVSDFVGITRGMLEPLLDKEVPIQLPKIITKKKGEVAYPFIDRDAKQAIKRLLKQMNAQGRTDPNEPMIKFKNTRKHPENAVNTICQNLAEKSEISLGKYRLRMHCLRKFLTDKLASVCAQDKWKWFVGKSVSRASPYVSHEGREAYKEVMRFTNINSRKFRSTFTTVQLEKILKQRDQYIESLKTELEIVRKRQEETFDMVTDTKTQLEGKLAKRDEAVTELKQKIARLESVYEATAQLYKQLNPKELEKTIREIIKDSKIKKD